MAGGGGEKGKGGGNEMNSEGARLYEFFYLDSIQLTLKTKKEPNFFKVGKEPKVFKFFKS